MYCLNTASYRMLPLGFLLFATRLCFPPDSQPAADAEEPRVLRAGAYAANGYNGYLPTPEQHQLGGYETWRARSSYLEVDAATKIQSTLLSLLREVAAGSEFVVAGQLTGET